MALSVRAGPADGALLPMRDLEAAKPHRPKIHREQAAGERLSLRRSRVLRRSGLGRTCGACRQRLSGFNASAEQRLRSVWSEISANVQDGWRLDRVCLPPRPRPSAWAAADDLMRFIFRHHHADAHFFSTDSDGPQHFASIVHAPFALDDHQRSSSPFP
jgi:hypothetical protein